MTIETDPQSDYAERMEARFARLEVTAEYIQRDVRELKDDVRTLRRDLATDFRVLFAALITVALGLSALMATGFGWL
ncbi:hypothetical protein LP420_10180 [Massilia sp. B-10]|nr:hypothetical protein LP420_10180 [Massilia sp. B-10]UUZ55754.1 hypothetical protein LP419_09605 [Massilia sp. H-1]